MDSYGLGKTNGILNFLSGNVFPMKSNGDTNPVFKNISMYFSWIIMIIYFTSSLVVVFLIPHEIVLQSNTVSTIVNVEVILIAVYMNIRLPFLERLVNKMKEILIENSKLEDAISQTLDPITKPINIYLLCIAVSVTIWCGKFITKLFDQDQFTYTDFVVPSYFPFEPFTKTSFTLYSIISSMGSLYTVAKKSAIDVYIIYIIAILTSHYKYLRNDLADILNTTETKHRENLSNHAYERMIKKRLVVWIRHHQVVQEIGRMLRDLTSLNVILTYLNSSFRLCFLGYMMIKMRITFFERLILLMYTGGALIQLYLLGLCVQALLDASCSVTSKAFHGQWCTHSTSTQKIFNIIIMADNIDKRLSAFGTFDLSLSTFMQIINNAYSACLFLLSVE